MILVTNDNKKIFSGQPFIINTPEKDVLKRIAAVLHDKPLQVTNLLAKHNAFAYKGKEQNGELFSSAELTKLTVEQLSSNEQFQKDFAALMVEKGKYSNLDESNTTEESSGTSTTTKGDCNWLEKIFNKECRSGGSSAGASVAGAATGGGAVSAIANGIAAIFGFFSLNKQKDVANAGITQQLIIYQQEKAAAAARAKTIGIVAISALGLVALVILYKAFTAPAGSGSSSGSASGSSSGSGSKGSTPSGGAGGSRASKAATA